MKDRLSKFITSEGLTPALLADKLGVHRSGISHILSGRNNARFDFIKNLLERFPKLNAEWLILGQGPMYKSSEAKKNELFSNEKTPVSPTLPEKAQNISSVESEKKIVPATLSEILTPEKPKKTIEQVMIFYTDKTIARYVLEN